MPGPFARDVPLKQIYDRLVALRGGFGALRGELDSPRERQALLDDIFAAINAAKKSARDIARRTTWEARYAEGTTPTTRKGTPVKLTKAEKALLPEVQGPYKALRAELDRLEAIYRSETAQLGGVPEAPETQSPAAWAEYRKRVKKHEKQWEKYEGGVASAKGRFAQGVGQLISRAPGTARAVREATRATGNLQKLPLPYPAGAPSEATLGIAERGGLAGVVLNRLEKMEGLAKAQQASLGWLYDYAKDLWQRGHGRLYAGLLNAGTILTAGVSLPEKRRYYSDLRDAIEFGPGGQAKMLKAHRPRTPTERLMLGMVFERSDAELARLGAEADRLARHIDRGIKWANSAIPLEKRPGAYALNRWFDEYRAELSRGNVRRDIDYAMESTLRHWNLTGHEAARALYEYGYEGALSASEKARGGKALTQADYNAAHDAGLERAKRFFPEVGERGALGRAAEAAVKAGKAVEQMTRPTAPQRVWRLTPRKARQIIERLPLLVGRRRVTTVQGNVLEHLRAARKHEAETITALIERMYKEKAAPTLVGEGEAITVGGLGDIARRFEMKRLKPGRHIREAFRSRGYRDDLNRLVANWWDAHIARSSIQNRAERLYEQNILDFDRLTGGKWLKLQAKVGDQPTPREAVQRALALNKSGTKLEPRVAKEAVTLPSIPWGPRAQLTLDEAADALKMALQASSDATPGAVVERPGEPRRVVSPSISGAHSFTDTLNKWLYTVAGATPREHAIERLGLTALKKPGTILGRVPERWLTVGQNVPSFVELFAQRSHQSEPLAKIVAAFLGLGGAKEPLSEAAVRVASALGGTQYAWHYPPMGHGQRADVRPSFLRRLKARKLPVPKTLMQRAMDLAGEEYMNFTRARKDYAEVVARVNDALARGDPASVIQRQWQKLYTGRALPTDKTLPEKANELLQDAAGNLEEIRRRLATKMENLERVVARKMGPASERLAWGGRRALGLLTGIEMASALPRNEAVRRVVEAMSLAEPVGFTLGPSWEQLTQEASKAIPEARRRDRALMKMLTDFAKGPGTITPADEEAMATALIRSQRANEDVSAILQHMARAHHGTEAPNEIVRKIGLALEKIGKHRRYAGLRPEPAATIGDLSTTWIGEQFGPIAAKVLGGVPGTPRIAVGPKGGQRAYAAGPLGNVLSRIMKRLPI